MDHLTNFYKHKSEQLQEQFNHLKRMLNEAMPPIPPIHIPPTHIPHIPNIPDVQITPVRPRGSLTAAQITAAAAEAAAHLAAVRAMMGTLLNDLRMLPHGSWSQMYNEVFTPLEKEAFIALFGSANPPILLGSYAGIPAQFIKYMTPNGEWVVMYNHAVVSGHPRWLPVLKGETPFPGYINSQGFLVPPTQVLNNTPGDIFVNPNPNISTTPSRGSGGGSIGGGGLGSQTGGPVQ